MIVRMHKVWRVTCDSCGSQSSHMGFRTPMHLELTLRQNGWYTDAKQHICPACKRILENDRRLPSTAKADAERDSIEKAFYSRDSDAD